MNLIYDANIIKLITICSKYNGKIYGGFVRDVLVQTIYIFHPSSSMILIYGLKTWMMPIIL